MLLGLVLPVVLDQIRHNLSRKSTCGLVARRIAEGFSVFAKSCLDLKAVYSRVQIYRKEEVLQLLNENQNNINQSSTTLCLISHRLSRRTDRISQDTQAHIDVRGS